MRTPRKIIAVTIAAVSLAVVGVAVAHPGMGMGMGMGQGMGQGMPMGMGMGQGMGHGMPMGMGMGGPMQGTDMAANASTRLVELKAALKITPVQEAAWQKYETLVQQQSEAMQAMRSAMQTQDPQAASASDRAAHRASMFKFHEAQTLARDAARTELLAVLTPAQKAIANQRMGAGYGPGLGMAMRMPAR